MNLEIRINTGIYMEIKIDSMKCTRCKKCADACNRGVLDFFEGFIIAANPKKCTACFKCENVCPTGALT